MEFEIRRGCSGPEKDTDIRFDESETRFTAKTASEDAAYRVDFRMELKSGDSYIMLPACAYDGNRFEAVARHYPPMFTEEELGADVPVRITQVPRLAPSGDSFMDVTTGDMSVPCVCVLDRRRSEAFMLFTQQGAHGLNHGVTVEQSGNELLIRLRAPAKRRLVYRWYEGVPSLRENPEADAPLKVSAGEETVIVHRVFTFPCRSVTDLFRAFFDRRRELYHGEEHASLPFSAFGDMAVKEHDESHFVEDEGYYALAAQDGRDTSPYSKWQAGWVGGGMSSLVMLCEGSELSRRRAVRTLEFASRRQSRAGWYYGVAGDGKILHDCFGHFGDKYSMLMVRKHADLTFFMFKHLEALRRMGEEVPGEILSSAVRAADALVTLWRKNGQLGQFINAETGEILVGGSTSGAMAPAALCAAASFTGDEKYASCAAEIGRYYYETATKMGVTTGGPGEILQCPDSESAAALTESFMALYEADGDPFWLTCAEDAAHQLSGWVVPYDYAFPPQSRFAKMGVRTAGSVWANVQNKHSAPGLCTVSPASLMKLFRATGDERYLELMRSIAHFMPQCASYPGRPIITMGNTPLKPGEMCERVNMSDWEGTNNVGDSIFGASSWPEVSLMLTWLEIPGVYVVPSKGIVCVSDHVSASLEEGALVIRNTTRFPARVKVMAETEEDMKRPLGLWWQDAFTVIGVPAGESVRVPLKG